MEIITNSALQYKNVCPGAWLAIISVKWRQPRKSHITQIHANKLSNILNSPIIPQVNPIFLWKSGGQRSQCGYKDGIRYCKYYHVVHVALNSPLGLLCRIICQIISLQTIHYLTLSTLLPPFLTTLTSPDILTYSGGPSTVSHVMDWREMAARPTVNKGTFPGVEGWKKLRGAWAGGKWIGKVKQEGEMGMKEMKEEMWDYGVDKKRGWVIAGTWMLAFAIE